MRIAYLMQAGVPEVRQPPFSGPANHVREVFCRLQELGHQVRLLAFYGQQAWLSDDLESFTPLPVPLMDRGPLRLLERAVRRVQWELKLPYVAFFDSLRFLYACRQALAGYDLLYERMGWMGYAGALASRLLGTPLVLEVNGDHLTEFEALGIAPRGVQRWLSWALTRWAARRATHVVATGDGWARKFIERWGVSPNSVSVIENGSHFVELLAREDLQAFRPDDNPRVTAVYIGAFEPWHGLDVLIRAVARVIQQQAPLRLDLIGGGTEEQVLMRLVQELALDDTVSFAGFLPPAEITDYLRRADIGLSPYCGRVEYSGLKLLDYKAAGLAVIASGADGEPAVIEPGRTGLIVLPCDEQALCRALIQLVQDAETRKRMGRQARHEAEARHSWRHTALALQAVFGRVVHI